MATTPGQGTVLEALAVTLEVDDKGFLSHLKSVDTAIGSLEQRLVSFADNVNKAMAPALKEIGKAFSGIGRFLQGVTSVSFRRLDEIGPHIENFTRHFSQMSSVLANTDMTTVSNALAKVGSFTKSLSNFQYDPGKLNGLSEGLKNLFSGLSGAGGAVTTNVANLELVAKTLGKLTPFMSGLTRFDTAAFDKLGKPLATALSSVGNVNTAGADAVGRVLSRIGNALNRFSNVNMITATGVAAQMPGLMTNIITGGGGPVVLHNAEQIALAIGHVATSLRRFGNVNMMTAAGVANQMPGLMQSLTSHVHLAPDMAKIAQGLHDLARASAGFNKTNYTGLYRLAQAVQYAVNMLNGVVISPAVAKTIDTLVKLADALRQLKVAGGLVPPKPPPPPPPPRGGAGGAGGGWFGSWFSGANKAVAATDGLNRSFNRLTTSGQNLIASMFGLRNAMVSMGGGMFFGMREALSLDDALTKIMMHTRGGGVGRPELMAGVIKLSGRTRTSATELAGALDTLMSNGMNAAMAMDALARAEDFALAGGMSMAEATRRLVDVQRSFGLNTTDAAKHLRNMTYLSDAFVAVAPKMGTSVDELSSAFSGKLAMAVNATNMSVEQGITLMAAMSTLGSKFRGATGGDFAARTLNTTLSTIAKNRAGWKILLGEDPLAGGRMMDPASMSDLITRRLGTGGTPERRAQILKGMGFQSEAMAGIEALIGLGDEIRRAQAEIAKMGGISKINADMMRNNLTGQMIQLRNNALNVATVVGERLAPVLFEITAPLISAAQWFTRLDPAMQNLIVVAGIAALSAYPLYVTLSMIGGMALAPFRMLGGLIFSIGEAAASTFRGIYSFAATIPGMVSSAAKNIRTLADNIWYFFWTPLRAVGHVITHIAGWVSKLSDIVGNVLLHGTDMFIKMLSQGLLMLMGGVINVALGIAAVVLLWPVMIAGAAAVAAVLVTIGTTLVSVGAALAGGIAAMWAGFRSAVSGAFAWMVERTKAAQAGIAGMWESFKGSAAEAFRSIGDAINRVAGFLWNFRENIRIVGEWWKVNWETAVVDIGKFTAVVLENLAGNAMRIFSAVGVAIGEFAWTGVKIVYSVFRELWRWLIANWTNLWSDAGMYFKRFLDAVIENFNLLLPVIDQIGSYIRNRLFTDMWLTDKAAGDLAKRDKEWINFEFKKAVGKLNVSPFEDMPAGKTDWSELGRTLSQQFRWAPGRMGEAGGRAWGAIGKMLNDLAPLTKGFTAAAPWAGLLSSLKLGLPEGGVMGALEKAFTGSTKMDVGAAGAGPVLGTSGPGYGFKQISMERFEVGGDLQESLDYQQLTVLQMIRRDTAAIAEANRSRMPAGPPMRPVVATGGD